MAQAPDPIGNQSLAAMAREIDQLLGNIRQCLRRPLETEFASGQLTGPQRSLMQTIVESGPLSLKELSAKLGLAHSTVSVLVRRLEKKGMLQRAPDPDDGRITQIDASPVVRNFLSDRVPQLLLSPVVQALRRAKPGQRKDILHALRQLNDLVDVDSRKKAKQMDQRS
jgi:DNA-binding MarR family transcriptional regulator